MKRLIILLALGIAGMSCSQRDAAIGDPEVPDGKVAVRLVVQTPASTLPVTKTTAVDYENRISEIQIFVFEGGIYKYRVPGVSISTGENGTGFSAQLTAGPGPVRLHIVANATAAIEADEPQPGESEAQVRARIAKSFGEAGLSGGIPMFGDYDLASLNPQQPTTVTGVQMLRSVARVDVQGTDVAGYFQMETVQLFRTNDRMQVIPAADGIPVAAPSIHAQSSAAVNTRPVAVDGNLTAAQLYLPESSAPAAADRISKATCIVVGGRLNGGPLTYYRIDFYADDPPRLGQVLRNYRYLFNIRSVSGDGWPTPAEAAENQSSHIVAEVRAWDAYTEDMHFDGSHYFGVSSRTVALDPWAASKDSIRVATDLDSYTMQWADADGKPLSSSADVLDNGFFRVEKTGNGTKISVAALTLNPSGNPARTAYVLLKASRWNILLAVRQNIYRFTPLTVLSFSSGLGYLGSNTAFPQTSPEARGRGLAGILTRPANFGTAGIVPYTQFNLISSGVSANKLPPSLFEMADIVFLNYMANASFGVQDATRVQEWLRKDNRVLVMCLDATDVNQNISTVFGVTGITYYRTYKGPFTLAQTGTYFTDSGPFTTGTYSPVAAGYQFRCNDEYYGEFSAAAYPEMTPILTGSNGGIVLGVDYAARIVYCGDIDLFNDNLGLGGSATNRINNQTGDINTPASQLIANLWAWIAGTVLAGK